MSMEWQPIETAPKDGTIVLACGKWAGEIGGIGHAPEILAVSFSGSTDYKGFDWSVEGTSGYAAWLKPTHWMPLPAAPTPVVAA